MMVSTKRVRNVPSRVFTLHISVALAKLLAHTAIDLNTSREALIERILEEHVDQYVEEAKRAQE